MRASTLFTMAGVASLASASYVIQDNYTPANFFSMFTFWTAADPTNGYVSFLDQTDAQTAGIISTGSSSVYMGVDHTNVVSSSASGRQSVRITSKNTYNHGLMILDASHMPVGCGTWPAFWTVGPSWPTEGEIDIIEGVNTQSLNLMSMHTSDGCSVSNNGLYTGTTGNLNCYTQAAGQSSNTGCQISATSTSAFGAGFNSAQGGVYAMEWTSSAISIWFFPRTGTIPSDIAAGTPNPSGWPEAMAVFSGSCSIDSHFMNQQIVFDTTFCGDWAGAVWSTDSTCSALASTCTSYVQNNPSAFANAYWTINSLKVYQNTGASSTTTTSTSTKATTTTTTSSSTTTLKTTTTTTTSTSTSTTKTSTSSTSTSTKATFTRAHHKREDSSPNEHLLQHQQHKRHGHGHQHAHGHAAGQ